MAMEKRREARSESDWQETVLEIKRTSKKTKGGNQIAFTALVVVGDGRGRVGYCLARARDVASAIRKAMKRAREKTITVPLEEETIPHRVETKFKAARVILKPGRKGAGLIVGSVVRPIASAAGIKDLTAKLLGTKNKDVCTRAVFKALKELRK